ncbi:hypothetical protein [Ascidiimonas sp. W6]|uniref:hypothetical protein n=1 Tax=Ascidiimonas meishanensis TaxID=3128903 RepID=UPI0030EB36B6
MKKISFTTIMLFILFACTNQDNSKDNIQNTESELELDNFPTITKNASVSGIILPDGSQIEKINNSTIKINLPKGYYIANTSGRLLELTSGGGSYTCTCSGSNGCNVFYVKGNYGCSHGSCTGNCTGSFSDRNGKEIDIENIFIINEEDVLAPATEDEFESLPYMPKNLILSLRNEFKSYATTLYGNKSLEALEYVDRKNVQRSDINDIMLVKMKMYGYKFIYSVNTSLLKPEIFKSNKFLVLDYDGGGHSCNCDSGQSGCSPDSSWGVKYCEGGACTNCTMTVS